MLQLIILSCLCIQDPIPYFPQVEPEQGYFAGASSDDKAFIDAARAAVRKSDMGRIQKWRIERRLSKPRFVELAKREIAADIYWDDPDQVAAIDWSKIDWEQILSIILMIIKLLA